MTVASLAERPLTQKQESFCLFIFQGLSQRDAYLKAGYSGRAGLAVVDTEASILLDSPKITKRIAQLRQKVEDAAIGTVSERQKRLTDIYRANLVDFLDEEGKVNLSKDVPHHAAVSEYSVTQLYSGEEKVITKKTLKLRDPIEAIKEHNRMERIGQTDTIINNTNDNRTVNIFVKSEEGKQALEQLKAGKLPQLQKGG